MYQRHLSLRVLPLLAALVGWLPASHLAVQAAAPALAPAVAVEAEEFTIEKGWKVLRNGEGNYMVDIIGFCHIGGERLLSAGSADTDASAFKDVQIPVDGNYRLWARYEYPAFCETRFKVVVQQNGKTVAEKVLGAKDNPRMGFGSAKLVAQHDPSWGPEGLFEEPMDVPGLKAGPARIYLHAAEQPQIQGVSANRNIDLIYLTSDVAEAWFAYGKAQSGFYPILTAYRDTRGARYEVSVVNKGDKPLTLGAQHHYNRVPWGVAEGGLAKDVAPGQRSAWAPLTKQDTTHFSMVTFTGNVPYTIEIRSIGGAVEKTIESAGSARVYLPPYPGMGDKPITPEEQLDAVLAHLKNTPAPGKVPTLPLAYGGWLPIGDKDDYGRKYGQLYNAIGMRAFPSTIQTKEVMDAAGLPLTKSAQVMGYRNPPTTENIAAALKRFTDNGLLPHLKWFDYGDEIHFAEWVGTATAGKADTIPALWQAWLSKHRKGYKPQDYWLESWGAFDAAQLKPDSSAAASTANAKLYVDSVLFFEDTAIDFVAAGNKAVKAALGPDVLCGANYSARPFYLPPIPMYVHWFRRGAADMGRHSEYFWQVAQAGPMINGYVAEHFRTGMRFNPKAINRQYTMPHAPGNTEASFMRTAFSHIAHGAKALDYFGIGMNECFTENHIDHRAHDRYRQIRDINHSLGLVEDLMLASQVVPSDVAILLSDSTERWDLAPVAGPLASHSMFGAAFRQTRLNYHTERLGLWKALTFAGASPDLIVEEDLNDKILDQYKLLFVVGDCLPLGSTKALEKWVKRGGTLVATAGAGQFGTYREPNPELAKLLNIASRQIEEREVFMRPRQELPFLKPHGNLSGEGWEMPAMATHERITPGEKAAVLATFEDDQKPAVIETKNGKGRVVYVAALPGVAYLWSALQPPQVPDRGVVTHTVPEGFDKGAAALIRALLTTAGIDPPIQMPNAEEATLLDARLIKADKAYILPLANYSGEVGKPVTLSVKLDGKAREVISSYHGKLEFKQENGRLIVTVPKLGYGDMLRINQ